MAAASAASAASAAHLDPPFNSTFANVNGDNSSSNSSSSSSSSSSSNRAYATSISGYTDDRGATVVGGKEVSGSNERNTFRDLVGSTEGDQTWNSYFRARSSTTDIRERQSMSMIGDSTAHATRYSEAALKASIAHTTKVLSSKLDATSTSTSSSNDFFNASAIGSAQNAAGMGRSRASTTGTASSESFASSTIGGVGAGGSASLAHVDQVSLHRSVSSSSVSSSSIYNINTSDGGSDSYKSLATKATQSVSGSVTGLGLRRQILTGMRSLGRAVDAGVVLCCTVLYCTVLYCTVLC